MTRQQKATASLILYFTIILIATGGLIMVAIFESIDAERAELHRLSIYTELSNQGRVLPVCAEEDSDNCYWDASERGNKLGLDFVTINGTTYYLGK